MSDFIITDPILLTGSAFLLSIAAAWITHISFRLQKSMILSLILLPPVVCAALLAINGSLGVSMAILGVFGLVRFRSMPGSSTDIVSIFYAMVIGLLASTGQIVTAALLSALIGLMILAASQFMKMQKTWMEVRITAPENITSSECFEQILKQYGKKVRLEQVKTAAMGSVYELRYVFLPDSKGSELKMLDEIRTHNCNMNVVCSEICQENSQL